MKSAVGFLVLLLSASWGEVAEDGGVATRRNAVIAARTQGTAAIPLLQQALSDPSNLVRRAAVRGLLALGEPARPALEAALANSDGLVRRAAIGGLLANGGEAGLAAAEKALGDPDEALRLAVITALVALEPRTPAVLKLIQRARHDASADVRRPAQDALWPFHKDTVLFRQRPDVVDQLTRVQVVATVPLPADGWLFRLDPQEQGHDQNWFAPQLPAADWKPIAIEQYWQKAGYEYEGVAWYRRTVTLPARPSHQAAELKFGAVDESAWVWINGQFVGEHDLGPNGWDKPFALDVTAALRWGQDNQLTVRVLNTKFAGGIWKPVTIEALTLK